MPRGRPRKTDPDQALDTVMKVFWERGFDGTSMADLSAATGMAKPGLYATFGDKDALYAKALGRYTEVWGKVLLDDLAGAGEPLRLVLQRVLERVVDSAADDTCPGGCFVMNGLLDSTSSCEQRAAPARAFAKARRDAFVARFEAAKKAGELPDDADSEALADYFSGQLMALAALARGGTGQEDLKRVAALAMQTLPAEGRQPPP